MPVAQRSAQDLHGLPGPEIDQPRLDLQCWGFGVQEFGFVHQVSGLKVLGVSFGAELYELPEIFGWLLPFLLSSSPFLACHYFRYIAVCLSELSLPASDRLPRLAVRIWGMEDALDLAYFMRVWATCVHHGPSHRWCFGLKRNCIAARRRPGVFGLTTTTIALWRQRQRLGLWAAELGLLRMPRL